MSWAKVGMKAVCISDGRMGSGTRYNLCPAPGTVCVISGVTTGTFDDEVALIIEGFPNACPMAGRDVGWRISRFRPIVSKTQSEDVAMFKRIADQVPNMEEIV